jgi:hypothetical protein
VAGRPRFGPAFLLQERSYSNVAGLMQNCTYNVSGTFHIKLEVYRRRQYVRGHAGTREITPNFPPYISTKLPQDACHHPFMPQDACHQRGAAPTLVIQTMYGQDS